MRGISSSNESLKKQLNRLADSIQKKYNINIWFVEILGKRWSYIAGRIEYTVSTIESIRVSTRFGFVAENWGLLNDKERENILNSVKEIFKKYE